MTAAIVMEPGELWNYLPGVIFTLSGGGLILWQALAVERAVESRKWPRAPGKVMRSFVDRRENSEGPIYLVKVICRYKIGDTEHICSRLRFGLPIWSYIRWTYFSRALRKYTAGDDVEVFYNPKKPEDSVLEPGLSLTLLSGFAFGFLFFALGILALRQGVG
jgi:ribosomal protein L21E